MIDTHAHLYSKEFDDDIEAVVSRARQVGIEHIILPNVDASSIARMHDLEARYPNYCHAAMGLHPTSVDAHYKASLAEVDLWLKKRPYVAIGEIGIDLYWDKTYLNEQIEAFEQQISWALQYRYPVIIHMRDSFDETFNCLQHFSGQHLTGVFHSFTGTTEQAEKIIAFGGFKFGINGVVTFKNSGLDKVVSQIGLEHLLLETDAPYLTPTPHRGKRNETSYTALVAQKLASVFDLPMGEVEKVTSENTKKVFPNVFL
jgi:TatD DNase family protein